MICEKCGREFAEITAFCSACGTQQGAEGNSVGDFEVGHGFKTCKFRYVILAVVSLALLIACTVFWVANNQNEKQARAEAQHEAASAAAKQAIDAVGRIHAAVRVGVTFENYTKLLTESTASVDSYSPEDVTGKSIKASLSKSVEYYQAASEAWNDDIQDSYNYDALIWNDQIQNSIDYDASIWNLAYPDLNLDVVGFLTPDDVRQAAWGVADLAFKDALAIHSTYANSTTE